MVNKYALIITLGLSSLIFGCNRKNHPARTPDSAVDVSAVKSSDSAVAKKVLKPTRKNIIPNTIVVNDSVARKSIDGRLYYDLLGHRYWKNYKDGKYYLFNKSMYTNDAFKKPN